MTEKKEKKGKKENSLLKHLKKDFFYGLIVILPLIATIWLVWFIINIISGPISSIFGQKIPVIISFFISLFLIAGIGIAARNFLGKLILNFIEDLMHRIPVVNTIYKSSKQLVHAFTLKDRQFLSAVLVEYPRKDVWALAFVTSDFVEGVTDKDGNDVSKGKISLFVPTTPNPTSGYFIFVNREDVIPLSMSIDESIKMLMSAGVLIPSKKKNEQ